MVMISDLVYGEIEVTDSVLVELMASAPLQRLKKINQHGARPFVITTGSVNRYDHCVGVMLLLRKLGANIEEQIAGLLHDVPHTAFSHVIDYVFENDNEEHIFHENFFEKIVMNSEIPLILQKNGFDVKRVINESLFGLLEKNIPDLCADRLDYSFRDFVAFCGKDEKIERFVSHLIVHEREIIFDDLDVALEYAKHYLIMDREQWAHPLSVASYHYLARALKRGLAIKILTFDDLFLTDDIVFKKLQTSNDVIIQENLSFLVPTLKVERASFENADIHSMAKLRYVDPKVLQINEEIIRVSEMYPELLEEIDINRKKIANGVFLKVINKI